MDLTPQSHARYLKDLEASVDRARQSGPGALRQAGRSIRAVAITATVVLALYLTFGAIA